jgi:hypothetical protein
MPLLLLGTENSVKPAVGPRLWRVALQLAWCMMRYANRISLVATWSHTEVFNAIRPHGPNKVLAETD